MFLRQRGHCVHSLTPYAHCACFDDCHVLHGAAGQGAAVQMSTGGFKQAWDSEKITYFCDIRFQEVPSMRNGKIHNFRQLTKSKREKPILSCKGNCCFRRENDPGCRGNHRVRHRPRSKLYLLTTALCCPVQVREVFCSQFFYP